jgi:hypothetical protein
MRANHMSITAPFVGVNLGGGLSQRVDMMCQCGAPSEDGLVHSLQSVIDGNNIGAIKETASHFAKAVWVVADWPAQNAVPSRIPERNVNELPERI